MAATALKYVIQGLTLLGYTDSTTLRQIQSNCGAKEHVRLASVGLRPTVALEAEFGARTLGINGAVFSGDVVHVQLSSIAPVADMRGVRSRFKNPLRPGN
jgi:hypothetical protein